MRKKTQARWARPRSSHGRGVPGYVGAGMRERHPCWRRSLGSGGRTEWARTGGEPGKRIGRGRREASFYHRSRCKGLQGATSMQLETAGAVFDKGRVDSRKTSVRSSSLFFMVGTV